MSIDETASKIEKMEIRGAGEIARSSVLALKDYALNLDEKDPGKYLEALREGCMRLKNTRPTAVSLSNALSFLMRHAKGDSVLEIRNNLASAADEFVESSLKAIAQIADIGSHRIVDGDMILTHCNSTAAIGAIIRAHRDDKRIKVYATETRPRHQGYITAKVLAGEGVDVTLIVDSAVRFFMQEVDIVIIGADTVASNGFVINKIGTSQVALCAHEARVPVLVCAETYKFSRETVMGRIVEIEERDPLEIVDPAVFDGLDVRVKNPVFDATPPRYIDSIVTEVGVISPYAAFEIIKKLEED
ncbi:MAG: ribose 1,5-bisphosphate isomerase [Candidatus Syntropharchaeales archaeon]|nr:ribose 1,5-bisphosphate isomerase [Candidatus Syntrophoarchaeum sp.]